MYTVFSANKQFPKKQNLSCDIYYKEDWLAMTPSTHNWPHRRIMFTYCNVENEFLSSSPVWLAYSLRDPKHWLGEGGAGEKVIMLQTRLSPFAVRGLIKHPPILQCISLGPCSCVVLHYGRTWRLLAVWKLLWQLGFLASWPMRHTACCMAEFGGQTNAKQSTLLCVQCAVVRERTDLSLTYKCREKQFNGTNEPLQTSKHSPSWLVQTLRYL